MVLDGLLNALQRYEKMVRQPNFQRGIIWYIVEFLLTLQSNGYGNKINRNTHRNYP